MEGDFYDGDENGAWNSVDHWEALKAAMEPVVEIEWVDDMIDPVLEGE